jgi:hypothetical protein
MFCAQHERCNPKILEQLMLGLGHHVRAKPYNPGDDLV